VQHIPYIYDTSKMTSGDVKATVDWIRSLGLNPAHLRSRFAIVRGNDEWELHVTRKLRTPGGQADRIDLAQQDVIGLPVIVHLGTLDKTWPTLGEEGLVK
jgi:hypothetical protein